MAASGSQPYKSILLFGIPGIGKGTQGKRLGEHDGFRHLATGDMFRSLDKESALGKKFVEFSSRGELVPDELTVELWSGYVESLIEHGSFDPRRQVLLLDGIPRSAPQAEMIADKIVPLRIVHLTTTDIEPLVTRLKKCAQYEGRHDDADETVVRRRFIVYENETRPVLDCYDPDIVVAVDGLGTIDEVAERVRAAVLPVYEAHYSSDCV